MYSNFEVKNNYIPPETRISVDYNSKSSKDNVKDDYYIVNENTEISVSNVVFWKGRQNIITDNKYSNIIKNSTLDDLDGLDKAWNTDSKYKNEIYLMDIWYKNSNINFYAFNFYISKADVTATIFIATEDNLGLGSENNQASLLIYSLVSTFDKIIKDKILKDSWMQSESFYLEKTFSYDDLTTYKKASGFSSWGKNKKYEGRHKATYSKEDIEESINFSNYANYWKLSEDFIKNNLVVSNINIKQNIYTTSNDLRNLDLNNKLLIGNTTLDNSSYNYKYIKNYNTDRTRYNINYNFRDLNNIYLETNLDATFRSPSPFGFLSFTYPKTTTINIKFSIYRLKLSNSIHYME